MNDSDFEKLLTLFANVQFTKIELDEFRRPWTIRKFRQSEFISEAGHIEQYFYFVLEGVQAIYIIDQKGEKVVLGFSYEGSPSGVFDSFIQKRPSQSFLEALKPSKMLAINLPDYLKLFESIPSLHKWGHTFFMNVLFGRLEREIELTTLSAEERYIAFMQRCPEELKVIPQKYLASYLNMTPETFSRLRSRVTY